MLDRHVAVVDTSVLINLAAAELLPHLNQLFVTIHLPQSVRGEILKWEESSRNSSQLSLVELLHPALFNPCTAGDHASQRLDAGALEGIVRTMAYVLPYARDLQPALTSELERKAYLQLTESNFKVPGWMLSTGTLRVLALLAVLRHPKPPPLIVVEEIENGLDPRSIHLLVEEIRNAVLGGVTQVVLTTHSPYLLDLLKLDQLVLVARDSKGEPRFHRPSGDAKLAAWVKEFAPGRLYTMGSLHEAAQ